MLDQKYRRYRLKLITVAVVVKMVISIYQYSWFLFAFSLNRELGWPLDQLGLVFTVFAFAVTFVQPFSGLNADAFGPRRALFVSGLLAGGGFFLASYASSPVELYFYYGIGGLGVGAINGIATASAIKWFPDRRGLATGLVEFGFGAGTLFFNHLIQTVLDLQGIRHTFFYLALFMWVVLIPCLLYLKYPPDDWVKRLGVAREKLRESPLQYTSLKMLGTHQWYLIYISLTLIVSVVLMFASQMKMLASEFGIPRFYFNLLLIGFPLGNGLSRIIGGVVSDRIGRELTMMIFFSLLGGAMVSLVLFGQNPWLFVFVVFVAGLLGGSPFVLFPTTIGDYYGSRHATANWGITVTGKAWSGLIGGWFSGFLVLAFGTFRIPLLILAGFCFMSAIITSPRFLRPPSTLSSGTRN